jgi:hypothetical protein
MSVFTILRQIMGVYSLLLTIFGFLLNSLSFIICVKLRNNSTFVLMAFFSFFKIFTLFGWNLNHFTVEFLDTYTFTLNGSACRILNYLQFNSLQLTAWFLVFTCVERVFCVFIKLWKTVYFTPQRALIASVCLSAPFLLGNLVLFFHETDFWINGTMYVFCFAVKGFPDTYWYYTYQNVLFYPLNILVTNKEIKLVNNLNFSRFTRMFFIR